MVHGNHRIFIANASYTFSPNYIKEMRSMMKFNKLVLFYFLLFLEVEVKIKKGRLSNTYWFIDNVSEMFSFFNTFNREVKHWSSKYTILKAALIHFDTIFLYVRKSQNDKTKLNFKTSNRPCQNNCNWPHNLGLLLEISVNIIFIRFNTTHWVAFLRQKEWKNYRLQIFIDVFCQILSNNIIWGKKEGIVNNISILWNNCALGTWIRKQKQVILYRLLQMLVNYLSIILIWLHNTVTLIQQTFTKFSVFILLYNETFY